MTKPNETASELPMTSISDFSLPDRTELGWSPAEHVFVQLETADAVDEVVLGEPVDMDAAAVIEFNATEVRAETFLADFGFADEMDVDLNGLFDSVTPLDQAGLEVVDAALEDADTTASQNTAADVSQDADSASFLSLHAGMGLGEVTFVVDDDGSDAVAL